MFFLPTELTDLAIRLPSQRAAERMMEVIHVRNKYVGNICEEQICWKASIISKLSQFACSLLVPDVTVVAKSETILPRSLILRIVSKHSKTEKEDFCDWDLWWHITAVTSPRRTVDTQIAGDWTVVDNCHDKYYQSILINLNDCGWLWRRTTIKLMGWKLEIERLMASFIRARELSRKLTIN